MEYASITGRVEVMAVMLYQSLESVVNLGALGSKSQESSARLLGSRRANVRLLLRIEFGGKNKCVFDIVDAKLGGLAGDTKVSPIPSSNRFSFILLA